MRSAVVDNRLEAIAGVPFVTATSETAPQAVESGRFTAIGVVRPFDGGNGEGVIFDSTGLPDNNVGRVFLGIRRDTGAWRLWRGGNRVTATVSPRPVHLWAVRVGESEQGGSRLWVDHQLVGEDSIGFAAGVKADRMWVGRDTNGQRSVDVPTFLLWRHMLASTQVEAIARWLARHMGLPA